MKRIVLLVLVAELFSSICLEGRDRGHAGARGVAPFRHPGATIRHGISGQGARRQGDLGFGAGRRGLGIRRSWPLYGSGLGMVYSDYNAPFQSQDYDAAPDSQNADSPNVYYYQKPAKQAVTPDCKDSWATQGSSSSLGNFMNRVFELQCQNRHPDSKADSSQGAEPTKN